MKKYITFLLTVASMGVFGLSLLHENVWAGGSYNDGGQSHGTGYMATCSYGTPIHSNPCEGGEKGGGKSWRVYFITDAVKKAVNKATNSGKAEDWNTAINKLSNGAAYKVVDGGQNGAKITGKKGLLKKCADNDAPLILLLGLNELHGGNPSDFYTAFDQTEPGGDCKLNRGCYYNWNKYEGIGKKSTFKKNTKNGKNVLNKLAMAIYNGYKQANPSDFPLAFEDVGGFCAWPDGPTPEEYTLLLYAVDEYNNALLNGKHFIDDDTVEKSKKATVSRAGFEDQAKEDGYVFTKWSESGCDNKKEQCSVSNMKNDQTIYAYYKKQLSLTAKSVDRDGNSLANVTGLGDKSTTGIWQGDPASVTRGTTEAGYDFIGWRKTEKGDIVSKDAKITVSSLTSNTTVYAVYEPLSGKSTLTLSVKNNSVTKYGNYAASVYAKPGDSVTFKSTYVPGAQAGKDLKPQNLTIDGGSPSSNSSNKTVEAFFNEKKSPTLGNWSNTLEFEGLVEATVKGTQEKELKHSLTNTKVGKFTENVATERGKSGVTPTEVSVGLNNSKQSVINVVTTQLKPEVSVIVPYNFRTSGSVQGFDDKVAFGGQSKRIEYTLNVLEKENKETTNEGNNRDYATRVDNVVSGLLVYYPGGANGEKREMLLGVGDGTNKPGQLCELLGLSNGVSCDFWLNTGMNTLNKNGVLESDDDKKIVSTESFELEVLIKDVSAGSTVCVAAANYPSTSGSNTNTDPSGDKKWNIYESKCMTVGKKPIIQVLGGNVYSGGSIETGLSEKENWNNNAGTHVFGSWGELGVISNGRIDGFASGASLAGEGGWSGGGVPCSISPLTFANCTKNEDGATSNEIGNIGTDSALGGIGKDRDGIMNLLNEAKGCNDAGDDGSEAKVIKCSTSVISENVGGGIEEGEIKIIYSNDSITINNNVTIDKGLRVSDLRKTPKLIIYSENDITIGCNVEEIDAVLIAKTVKTCDSDDINSPNNSSKQLRINGAVIAEKLEANRTYGAGPGDYSGVAAEIINFDPSLYLWSTDNGDEEKKESTHDIVTTYIRELAPRY